MGAFCIIVLKHSASQVTSLFSSIPVRFRDASSGPCHFFINLSHCFQGLEHAIKRSWFNYSTFDSAEYEFHSKPVNGDLNWIIPNQFLAFPSPAAEPGGFSKCVSSKIPGEKYANVFKTLKVRTVVRLNKAKYPASLFTSQGIKHYDLHYKDGTVPSIELVNSFIDICSSHQGAVAVHCKAGLGRTGTLIGCYSIKIFKFPAAAFIAWCRLCRPGSILGPQQQFLIDYEDSVKNKKKFCLTVVGNDCEKAVLGDLNQGNRLLMAKSRRSGSICDEKDFENNILQTPVKKNVKMEDGNEGNGGIEDLDSGCERDSVENEKNETKVNFRSSFQFRTPEKRSRFSYEIGKLCAKRYNGKYRNAFFYESAGKNLKSNRIYKILYGSNDEDVN